MINTRKYQTGGAAPQASQEQQIQEVVMQISQMTGEQPETVMAAIQAGGENFKQVIQALQQGDTQTAKQMIQQLAGGTPAMKRDAKLQYIKDLKGTCPDGTHLEYYRAGGRLCKKCMKNQDGGEMEQQKKGGVLAQYKDKIKKDCGGAKMNKCGGKMKKHQIGGTIETLRESLGLEKKN